MRAILCAIALSLVGGCSFTRPPTAIEDLEPQYGLFGLLQAGSDTVTVFVARFPPTGETQGVSGASVKIIAGGDTLVLAEQSGPGTACVGNTFGGQPLEIGGCYRVAVPGQVQVGATYGLVAEVPGFGRIVGSTRIPAPPTVISPTEGARFAATFTNAGWPTMPVRIEAPNDAERVEVTLSPADPSRTCQAYFIDYFGGSFGVLVVDPHESETVQARFLANCFTSNASAQPLGELPAVVRATTFDSAYARFAALAFDRSSQSILERHARAGIDRGVGYFAGAASAEVRIVLTGSGT